MMRFWYFLTIVVFCIILIIYQYNINQQFTTSENVELLQFSDDILIGNSTISMHRVSNSDSVNNNILNSLESSKVVHAASLRSNDDFQDFDDWNDCKNWRCGLAPSLECTQPGVPCTNYINGEWNIVYDYYNN